MKKTLTLIGLRREVYTSLMNCNERKRYASKMKYKTWQTFSTCHHLKKRTVYEINSKKSHLFYNIVSEASYLQLYLNFRAKNDQIELSYSENIFCAKIQIFKNGFWIFMPKMIKLNFHIWWFLARKFKYLYRKKICKIRRIDKKIRHFFKYFFFVANYST